MCAAPPLSALHSTSKISSDYSASDPRRHSRPELLQSVIAFGAVKYMTASRDRTDIRLRSRLPHSTWPFASNSCVLGCVSHFHEHVHALLPKRQTAIQSEVERLLSREALAFFVSSRKVAEENEACNTETPQLPYEFIPTSTPRRRGTSPGEYRGDYSPERTEKTFILCVQFLTFFFVTCDIF